MTLTQINKAGLDEIALDHVFTIGASGSSAYTFQGEGLNGTVNNPTLYLTRGKTYRFENGSGGHPIRIQSTAGASGTAYNTGVTNNAGSGTVIVEVQHDAPDVLYYQCTSHAAMNGILYITGALADGGVTTAKIAADAVTGAKLADNAVVRANITDGEVISAKLDSNAVTTSKINNNAVTTDKIAADAVTGAKIADDAVGNEHLADNCVNTVQIANLQVTTGKIADQAVTLDKLPHGTSSNDGKFLRANNGADPTFETVTGTTINNNAVNRVITGSGTANTLNGEANLIFDSGKLGIGMTPSSGTGYILQLESGQAQTFMTFGNTGTGNGALNGFVLGNDITRAYITQRENQNINIATNNIDRMILESDGDLRLSSDNANNNYGFIDGWVASTGDMVIGADQSTTGSSGSNLIFRTRGGEKARILNSGGITFNGDTAAANALDDYEEGSFTPQVKFGGNSNNQSYNSQTGRYTKIGNRVFFHLYFALTNKGTASGSARVYGLPFTSANVGSGYAHCSCWINTSNYGNTVPTGYVPPNQNYFYLERQRTDGAGVHSADHTNFNNTTDMMISGHYIV